MHPSNQSEQRFAIHERDRLAGCELPSVPGEVSRTHDDDLARILGREDAIHFPYDPHANAAVAPVLALDEMKFADLAQSNIDAAVRPSALVLDNVIAIPAVGFGDKLLKLALRKRTDGVQTSLALEKALLALHVEERET